MSRYRYGARRFAPIILTVVVIIISIALLVSLARALFFSGTPETAVVEEVDTTRASLLNTEADRSVSMTVRGSIVADEDFRSYRIAVSPSERKVETFTGYLGTVLERKTLSNNTAAYEEFVHALDKANLAEGTQLEGDANDLRGICASGEVYEFNLLQGDTSVAMLWTSTCSGSPGSLDVSVSQLTTLFRRQIPDVETMLRSVSL
ncbi:hypothetical protein B7Z17_05065 [Candidatus Saccharibacteria bacterium 32-49-10]|nr:MAG: hypothetical protein B7Z17_05065 [Candidatus Saccharibacteria bacterium 32-49-10]